ncbi:unnamed protein product, partial [Ectocarpus sp. 13 AM-2016]
CSGVRSRGGRVRAPAKGRGPQEEGDRPRRYPPRPGRCERPPARGAGRPQHDGAAHEAQEDGDHGEAPDGDQQGCEPIYRPGGGGAGAGSAVRGRGTHAGHRVLHVPQQ